MKNSVNGLRSSFLIICFTAIAQIAQATIYFDQEQDPLPLFSLQVVLPTGSLTENPQEAAAIAVYSEMLEDGTASLNKQSYLDALSAYGASVSFGVGRDTSSWSVSFPIIENKNYDRLIQLVKENWQSPRISEEGFEKAKVKLNAALQASLDNDMGLAALVGRRWMGINDFKLYPLFLESLKKLSLDDVKKVAAASFHQLKDVWAGYVGPKSHEELAIQFLNGVFNKQGAVKKGQLKKSLLPERKISNKNKGNKDLIIVEKSGRSQLIFFVSGLFPTFPTSFQEELALHFGGHILGFSGLGSYFGDEIRNKRGLAYTVSPLQKFYLGKPAVGFLTNPVRERNAEAIELIADLLKAAYEESDVFKVLPNDVWERQWQSFRFGHILDNSSVSARLALRQSVVSGELSQKLLESSPDSWNLTREEVTQYFRNSWSQSSQVIVVVGESKELQPLMQKHFPDFKIKVISLQDTLLEKSYN